MIANESAEHQSSTWTHRILLLAMIAGCQTPTAPASAARASSSHADDAPPSDFSGDELAAAKTIQPAAIASHIRFLADDLLEGRFPGTRGYALASRYVASELAGLGISPAGENDTYFQSVNLVAAKLVDATLELRDSHGQSHRFIRDEEFVGLPNFQSSDLTAEGDLVFVGYGLNVSEFHYDDFQGIDLKGKIAVCLRGAPASERSDFFPDLPSAVYGDAEHARREIKRRGAIAILWVWTPILDKTFPFPLQIQTSHFEQMNLSTDAPRLPQAFMSGPAFESLLHRAERKETLQQLVGLAARGSPKPFMLPVRGKLHVVTTRRQLRSDNVAGIVKADPHSATRNETLVFGAHLDHLGVGEPVDGDSIYNGASDDAAGVASLIEIGRAFASLSKPPPRNILFLFVTAEERGLLGSQWFSETPTIPLSEIIADVDVDGAYPINPLKDVIAIGADESQLLSDVLRASSALGLKLSPDPYPEQAYFVRSDNYNFVKQGIPAAQIFNGRGGLTDVEKIEWDSFWKRRYHQPQDEFEPNRDWKPFAELTRFDFLLGVSIAERRARPLWNAKSWFRRFPESSSGPN